MADIWLIPLDHVTNEETKKRPEGVILKSLMLIQSIAVCINTTTSVDRQNWPMKWRNQIMNINNEMYMLIGISIDNIVLWNKLERCAWGERCGGYCELALLYLVNLSHSGKYPISFTRKLFIESLCTIFIFTRVRHWLILSFHYVHIGRHLTLSAVYKTAFGCVQIVDIGGAAAKLYQLVLVALFLASSQRVSEKIVVVVSALSIGAVVPWPLEPLHNWLLWEMSDWKEYIN